jgi:hypothetical protein
MIQIATATSAGSWTRATSTGDAAASMPSGTALLSDGDQRPTTKARSDASNMIGSSRHRSPNGGEHSDLRRTRPGTLATSSAYVRRRPPMS